MALITVENFSKYYSVHKKKPGIVNSLSALVNRDEIIVKAVDNISFCIESGELIGFIGPNGAGKTTTLKCLSGLLYPTKGTVRVMDFIPEKRETPFLKKIALVMGQKSQLWWDLPAYETFLLNKEIYEVSDRQFQQTTEELIDILQVRDIVHIQVRKLSLGQRMKCELIGALVHNPHVLFLDEPTIGLDVVMQKSLRDFIRTYNQRYHATILLTSHYMTDVKELCKRVIIIDHGRIAYDGQLDTITKQFAQTKQLSIIFNKEVDRNSLLQFGTIRSYEQLKAIIDVPQSQSTQLASKLLQEFPVADLTIEEVDIEDIVRDIFSGKSHAQ